MTKREQRENAKDPYYDEGVSWFEYVRKDFERIGGTVPVGEEDRRNFFRVIGVIGDLADWDTDDVDYTLEEK